MASLARLLSLYRPARGWMALAILASVVASLAGVGLIAVSGWFIAAMAMTGAAGGTMNYFTPSALIRLFAILRAGGRYAERVVGHEATFRLLALSRVWLFARLVPLAPAALEDMRSGDMLARLKGDVDRQELIFLRLIVPGAAALATLVAVVAILAWLDPALVGAVAAILIGFGVALPALAALRARAPGRRLARTQALLRAALVETAQGLAPLLAAGAGGRRQAQLASLFDDQLSAERRLARAGALGAAGAKLSGDLALVAALALAIPLLRAGALSGPDLALAALVAQTAAEALAPLPGAFAGLSATLAATARLFDLADRTPLIADPPAPAPMPARSDLALSGLRFAYGEAPVLDGLDLDLPHGAHVAIFGVSGAGKSSLIDLLLRLRDPQGGRLALGGVETARLPLDALRRRFALAPQRPHVFADTIADNLRRAAPRASEARLRAALTAAGLGPFLDPLPEGLETPVGALGLTLSGGEVRRLALARAFLREDAEILLLDEPGEGLDPRNEADVLASARARAQGRTLLVFSHGRAGLEGMDRALRLEDGGLIAIDPGSTRG